MTSSTRKHVIQGLTSLLIGFGSIAGYSVVANAAPPVVVSGYSLVPLGTYYGLTTHAGGFAASEIVAFDAETDRMFITNGALNRVDIVSIATPAAPVRVGYFEIAPYGTGINSVAVGNGIVAAAVELSPTTAANGRKTTRNGKVVMFTAAGAFLHEVNVGVQPDHVSFTPDKKTILVAGEGEPVCSADDPATSSTTAEIADPALVNDPLGTISIIDVSQGATAATVTTLDFSSLTKTALLAENVRVFFPNSTAAQDLEPEYISVSPDGKTAYATLQENNAVAIIDLASKSITDVVSLGYKDWGASGLLFDGSDKDSSTGSTLMNPVSYAGVPLKGMYMPDSIATFARNGATYFATANEGDSRGYDCFNEEARFGDSGLAMWTGVTDSVLLSNKVNAKLGRNNTTKSFPTTEPLTDMYTYGARSFSIWNAAGVQVWDSGSQFEEYIQATYPLCFNSDADTGSGDLNTALQMKTSICTTGQVDKRSDNKGIEPEALAIGTIGTQTFAFIGFERLGGVAMYDISTPTAPTFLTYKNPAIDGSTGAGAVDVSPEGMVFVPAESSPIDKPLLLVANELSGTTTIYEVRTPTASAPAATAPSASIITGLAENTLTAKTTGLIPGEAVNSSLGGFVPFETVQLIVESTPTVIATGTANANGIVTLSGNLPSTLPAGSHRLSLFAPVSGLGGRTTISVEAAPVVTAAPAVTTPIVTTPIVAPETLPATGSGSTLTPLALALLSIGSLLIYLRRRRVV